MLKIAIIGANEFQEPLILKAKECGYETHVFAWEKGAVGKASADYFYPISIVEKEKILEKCKEIGIAGICSIGSDLAVLTVNYIAEKLGLNSNSVYCSRVATMSLPLKFTTINQPPVTCSGLPNCIRPWAPPQKTMSRQNLS